MAIDRVLANPVYAGLVRVEAFKDLPGGLFPAIHEPIVDKTTWTMVQTKMKKPDKVKVVIDDEIPLRGVVKCHCGTPLTGAPSRGKSGKYFYYYKCKHSKHNNISAVKAHEQFLNVCDLMSVPERQIKEIRNGSYALIEQEVKANKKKATEKKHELEEVQQLLNTVEGKWFKDEINKDTYERWYSTYSDQILNLTAAIERLSANQCKAFDILDSHLDLLGNIRQIYTKSDTLQKREFVKRVFDGNLYYQDGSYRTPTMLDIFSHKASKMEEKGCLIYKKRGKTFR
jgi:hypothetical protein